MRFHWSKHSGSIVLFTGCHQRQKPLSCRELVVIDEGDVVPVGVFDGFVSCQGDTLTRLDTVPNRELRNSPESQYYGFSRSQMIIVGNNNRVGEQASGFLVIEFL